MTPHPRTIDVALVYDLRDDHRGCGLSDEALAELDTPETIDALAHGLARVGARVTRVGHGRELARRLAAGERHDLVFSIAEGLSGRCREAQVAALCELFGQPYVFSDPLTLAAALDKSVAKHLVRAAGVPTAPWVLLRDADAAGAVILDFPLFVKPNAEGTGKGCGVSSRVTDAPGLRAEAARLIERFGQPVIVEPYLPGREFTVGIVGNGDRARVVGACEILLNDGADEGLYSLRNKEQCESLVTYVLAADDQARTAARFALAAYRALECRDAGRIDLRCDGHGRPQFMEANPLAGLHPTHSDLPIITSLAGLGYDGLLRGVLEAAAGRYDLAWTAPRTLEHATGT